MSTTSTPSTTRAALAVLTAVVAALVAGCGDEGRPAAEPASAATSSAAPSPAPSDPSSKPAPAPALPAYFLPGARDLPTRARLTPWERAPEADDPLVGCEPTTGPGLAPEEMIQRSFTARIAATGGEPAGEEVAAEVRVSILQYGSDADAEAAERTVLGWIRDCTEPSGFPSDGAARAGDLVELSDTGAGTYGTWTYPATELCTDCDAAWFDRMGVLADLGRMVVVSYREVGGPLEPQGLDAFMADLMLQAAGRSMPG